MSDDATVKTCPGGKKCHFYSESMPEGWFEGGSMEYLGGPQYGVQYCGEHHAELLPGGEVVPMVPLEKAVDGVILCPIDDAGGCQVVGKCGSPACRAALAEYLRKADE